MSNRKDQPDGAMLASVSMALVVGLVVTPIAKPMIAHVTFVLLGAAVGIMLGVGVQTALSGGKAGGSGNPLYQAHEKINKGAGGRRGEP